MKEQQSVKRLVDEKTTSHDGSQENSLPPMRGRVGVGGNSQHKPRPCGCNTRKLVNNRFPALKGWGLGFNNSGIPQSLINVKNLWTYSPIHLFTRKCNAFTLAEVLITLGVIGIVAAMTIPTILSKYQEHVMIQKYKKVYSLLNNALLQQYADNGSYYDCYYKSGTSIATLSGCKSMLDDIKNVLKTTKMCADNAYKNGCIPNYKGVDTVQHEQNLHPDEPYYYSKNCYGFVEKSIKNSDPAWVLNDGTILVGYNDGASYYPYFLVDINGIQGPNKWGYDLFTFIISNKNGTVNVRAEDGCFIPEDGGISSLAMREKAGFKN